jgi:hypothetical protein
MFIKFSLLATISQKLAGSIYETGAMSTLGSVAPLSLDKCYADFRDHLCHDVLLSALN